MLMVQETGYCSTREHSKLEFVPLFTKQATQAVKNQFVFLVYESIFFDLFFIRDNFLMKEKFAP